MGYRTQILAVTAILGSLLAMTSRSQQVYPSANTAFVIPGGYEEPEDPDVLMSFPTAESVRDWELQRSDLIFGGETGSGPVASSPYMFEYMYNQKLEFDPTALEMSLREQAEAAGDNYESLFLHFSEDTLLRINDQSHGALTAFGGFPYAAGWTTQPDHAGFLIYDMPPYDKPVWEHHRQEGGLYVYLFERFDRLRLKLAQKVRKGRLVVEYPSEVDDQGVVTKWSRLSVRDGTRHLSRNGLIRWKPPEDWKRAKTHDGSQQTYGRGPYFGQPLIRDGGRFYVVRLMWRKGSGTPPRLADIRLKNWMPVVEGKKKSMRKLRSGNDKGHSFLTMSPEKRLRLKLVKKRFAAKKIKSQSNKKKGKPQQALRLIRGWDPDNDRNNDGYVDNREYRRLANPNATARFEYEARVVPVGNMWSVYSSWCRPNLFHPHLGNYLANYYNHSWHPSLAGAYNDDLYKLLGDEFDVVSGGQLREYDGRVNSDITEAVYQKEFAKTLNQIRIETDRRLGANISMLNPYGKTTGIRDYLPAFSLFLREGLIRPSLGLSGWFGINRAWDTFVLAASDRWSILMATVNFGSRVSRLGNTEQNWQKDIESSLAQFYLMNVPGKTYFHVWNKSFNYGSGNTDLDIYYKPGVPKNIAYQPEGLLSVDIGVPVSQFPSGFEPLAYMARSGDSDYAIIGYSNDTQLLDPVPEEGRQTLAAVPSNIFYLQRSASEVVTKGPAEMVLARHYTNGLVLYRTDFLGHDADFQNSLSQEITLPGLYRRVLFDGSLSEPLSSIQLFGYEGVILQKAD